MMIRKHFVGRIAELSRQVYNSCRSGDAALYCSDYAIQVQDSDSNSSHYYAEVVIFIVYDLLSPCMHTPVSSTAQAAESQFCTQSEASPRPSGGIRHHTTAAG